jgi:hypothetical protein
MIMRGLISLLCLLTIVCTGCNSLPDLGPWVPPVATNWVPPVITDPPATDPQTPGDAEGFAWGNWGTWVNTIAPRSDCALDPAAVIKTARTDGVRIYVEWGPVWSWPGDGEGSFANWGLSIVHADGTVKSGRMDYVPVDRNKALFPMANIYKDDTSWHSPPRGVGKMYLLIYGGGKEPHNKRCNVVQVTGW